MRVDLILFDPLQDGFHRVVGIAAFLSDGANKAAGTGINALWFQGTPHLPSLKAGVSGAEV
jgi:hypothetical protein